MNLRKYVVLIITITMVSTAFFCLYSNNSSQGNPQVHVTMNFPSSAANNPDIVTPSNVVYRIPVTFYNNQSSPTANPYDQKVAINSSTYSSYEASNLQNVEWFTYYGTVIPSWIQLNDSSTSYRTVYWLKIPEDIAAYSQLTVFLGFAPKNSDLFSTTGNEGASPSSTSTYAQYDNGAVVFPIYFNGNAPFNSFSVNGISLSRQSVSFGTQTINALNFSGITYNRLTGWVYNRSSIPTGNFLLGTSFLSFYKNTVEFDMLNQSSASMYYTTGTGVGLGHRLEFYKTTITQGQWNQTPAFNATSAGWNLATVYASSSSVTIVAATNATPATMSKTFPVNILSGVPSSWAGAFWADGDGLPMSELINYLFAGIAPPNGIMPWASVNTTLNASVLLVPTGLAPGANWSVSYNSQSFNGTWNQTIGFSVTYGEVNLSINAPGYFAFPSKLTINVTTVNRSIDIEFSKFPYINAGYAKSTLFLSNGTLASGTPSYPGNGSYNVSLAFSTDNNYTYVSDQTSQEIVYFNVSGHVEGNISLKAVPGQVLYDPVNSMIYVEEPFNSSIAVINTHSESVVSIFNTSSNPVSMAVDSGSNTLYISTGIQNMGVIEMNATTGSIITEKKLNIPGPGGIFYDYASGSLYVIPDNASYIAMIAPNLTVTHFTIQSQYTVHPYFTYDPFTNVLYVSAYYISGNGNQSGLLEFNLTSNIRTGFFSVYPYNGNFAVYPYYDRANNMIYTVSSMYAGLFVYRTSGYSFTRLNTPFTKPYAGAITSDTSGNSVYSGEPGTNSVGIINLTRYQVTFLADYMSTETQWSVTFNNVTKFSNTSVITFLTGNGTFSYSESIVNYSGNYNRTSGIVTVNGKGITLDPYVSNLNSNLVYPILSYVYEAGVPYGHHWSITINGVKQTQTVRSKEVLTITPIYFFSGQTSMNYSVYSPGYVVVTRQMYASVYFPNGIPTSSNIYYAYELSSSGLYQGGDFNVLVAFFLPNTYNVTFVENGLDPGTFWDVTIGSTYAVSQTSIINVTLANGTYNYLIGTTGSTSLEYGSSAGLFGYAASPASGTVTVNGKHFTVYINFTKLTDYYTVNVLFKNFPTDYIFGATVGKISEYTTGSFSNMSGNSVYFMLKNGTYTVYSSAIPANGNGLEKDLNYESTSFTVSGANLTLTVNFKPSRGTYLVSVNVTGLPSGLKVPLNILGNTGTGSELDVIQNDSHHIVLALNNGSYSISYNTVSQSSYYYGSQLYWKISGFPHSLINFNGSGFMHVSAGLQLNLYKLSGYYFRELNFSVNGSGSHITLNALKEYTVTINIKGPIGGSWSGSINNKTFITNTHSFKMFVTNGTYSYSAKLGVGAGNQNYGLLLVNSTGNITIKGSNFTLNLISMRTFYLIVQSTLPSSLNNLTLQISGKNYSIKAGLTDISFPNGTYRYTIVKPAGYLLSPTNGTFRINGTAAYLLIYASAIPLSHIFSKYQSGYIGAIIAGILVSIILVTPVWMHRRK